MTINAHGGFEPFYFEENEFVECWDGCAEDQEFYGIDDEDEQEMLREFRYDHGTAISKTTAGMN